MTIIIFCLFSCLFKISPLKRTLRKFEGNFLIGHSHPYDYNLVIANETKTTSAISYVHTWARLISTLRADCCLWGNEMDWVDLFDFSDDSPLLLPYFRVYQTGWQAKQRFSQKKIFINLVTNSSYHIHIGLKSIKGKAVNLNSYLIKMEVWYNTTIKG